MSPGPRLVRVEALDIRFPTSRWLDGSDAMNPDPDYSAAYVILHTDIEGLAGHGFTFTIGRGTDLCVHAIRALAPLLEGRLLSEICGDMGAYWRSLAGDSQMRWLGPEKGIVHLALAAVVNATWDLWAKTEGKPLWRLIADLPPAELARTIDYRHITDTLEPAEAEDLVYRARDRRPEIEPELMEKGYPAYTTSAGWLGYPDDKIRALCAAAVAEGWDAIKMKVGRDLKDDIRRCAIVREAIGERRLMIDANQVWEVQAAIAHVRALAPYEPYWIEEPVSPDDILGHAAVRRAVAPVKVATGEHAHNRVMFKQLLQAEAIEQQGPRMVNDQVTDEDIAAVIAAWTGIPVGKLLQGESEKLVHLEAELGKRLIGQKDAVKAVSDAVRRSRAGISDPNRPTGSFLFLGPTGVGKTELAKTLAESLFDDEKNLVRIDMSEYMEKFSVSRLIGAPPGYVGYEEGGQLTEAVRRRPYSVILFDEIEKAHPDVFNILLQVLDDGRITDSQGRTVDFKNTVIILTSNLGSQYLLDGIDDRGNISQEARQQVTELLHRTFRPEFLNRLDEIVFYKPLTKDNICKIIDLQIAALNGRLADKQLKCELTDEAKQFIIDAAYDPQYGARPLRRYVQHTVETLLARRIVAGSVLPGATLKVAVQNGELALV